MLAAELVEKALHHLGGFGDPLAGVGDARLLDPAAEVHRVPVHVVVDVLEHLLEFLGNPGHVRTQLGIPLRPDSEFRGGRRGIRIHIGAAAAGSQHESRHQQREQGPDSPVAHHLRLLRRRAGRWRTNSVGTALRNIRARLGDCQREAPGGSAERYDDARFRAARAVSRASRMMSGTLAPRERSFTGAASPWRIGPVAVAPASRSTSL